MLDRDLYQSMVLILLHDDDTYKILVGDPTDSFKVALVKILEEEMALGVLSKRIFDHLNTQFPIVPIFHGLPKTQKDVFPPPLRLSYQGLDPCVRA